MVLLLMSSDGSTRIMVNDMEGKTGHKIATT